MAPLPNADRAVVSDEKLFGYLLNMLHQRGFAKGQFLASIGFDLFDPDTIRASLIRHGQTHDAHTEDTTYGQKFEVDGTILSPTGKTAMMRTVWQIDTGTDVPRFVTLKPLKSL